MFVGRKKELAILEKLYKKSSFEMAVVYGRRRVGKTRLISEFAKGKKTIFFSAKEVNDRLNINGFLQAVQELVGEHFLPNIDNWEDAFNYLYEKTRGSKIVLIIDEYPYAAKANKSLNSILQHFIDHKLDLDSNIFMILCGSQVSFMEDEVLAENSPLFGRKTTPIHVGELDYIDAAKFLDSYSNEDKVKFYSCMGGIPYYLSQVDKTLSFDENMEELYFDIYGGLYSDPIMVLHQELPEPKLYNSVLHASASGANRLEQIRQATYIEKSTLSKYLKTLVNMRIIQRNLPFDVDPLKSKNSHYTLKDNVYRFWFRYVFTNQEEIERGRGKRLYQREIKETLNEFIGAPAFEEISMSYLYFLDELEELPFFPKRTGSWRGKKQKGDSDEREFDIVMENKKEQKILIGECKWRNQLKTVKEIQKLMSHASYLPGYDEYYFYFFSKAPYPEQARELEKIHENLVLVTIDDLFDEKIVTLH